MVESRSLATQKKLMTTTKSLGAQSGEKEGRAVVVRFHSLFSPAGVTILTLFLNVLMMATWEAPGNYTDIYPEFSTSACVPLTCPVLMDPGSRFSCVKFCVRISLFPTPGTCRSCTRWARSMWCWRCWCAYPTSWCTCPACPRSSAGPPSLSSAGWVLPKSRQVNRNMQIDKWGRSSGRRSSFILLTFDVSLASSCCCLFVC